VDLSVGSSERNYSTSMPSPDGWNWLGRSSLGNSELGSTLLFNPKHPLKLGTNEFLLFRVRPIFWGGLVGLANNASISIQYQAYRTYGE
jgi:hypothetical protein